MTDKLLFNCSHGAEDPERATLPFVAANVAAIAGQQAVVLCTINAAWLGTTGGTDNVTADGYPDLATLYDEFVGNGGKVCLCGACTKPRNISEDQLTKGARIVGAAAAVEEIVNGAKSVAFA